MSYRKLRVDFLTVGERGNLTANDRTRRRQAKVVKDAVKGRRSRLVVRRAAFVRRRATTVKSRMIENVHRHPEIVRWVVGRFVYPSSVLRHSEAGVVSLSCCWSKGVEWPAQRCYVGLVAVGVQEQAEDILVPPLLRNCLTLNYISFS